MVGGRYVVTEIDESKMPALECGLDHDHRAHEADFGPLPGEVANGVKAVAVPPAGGDRPWR